MSKKKFRLPLDIPQNIIDLVPEIFAFEYGVIPYKVKKKKDKKIIYLAINDKKNMYAIDNLRFILNSEVKVKEATHEWIDEALQKYYTDRQWFKNMKEKVNKYLKIATDEQIAEIMERVDRSFVSKQYNEVIKRIKKIEKDVELLSDQLISDGELK